MTPEMELIRALAEDLAVEVSASYGPDDFEAADFSSLGRAAVYRVNRAKNRARRFRN